MESDMHARTHAGRKANRQAGWLAGRQAATHAAKPPHGKGDSTTYDQRRTGGWWDWVKERERVRAGKRGGSTS